MLRSHHIARIALAGMLWIAALAAARAQNTDAGFVTPVHDAANQTAERFHLGIGYVGGLTLIDPDGLNTLAGRIGISGFNAPLILHGLWGVVRYDGMIPNTMLSGYILWGSKSGSVNANVDTVSVTRTARFSVASLGLEIDYAAFEWTTLSILPGVVIARDAYKFEMTQERANGEPLDNVLHDEWDHATPTVSVGHYTKFTALALAAQPMLNIELRTPALPLLKARLGAGYRFIPFAPNWTSASGLRVGDMPSIRAAGWSFNLGISAGIFLQ